MYMKTWWKKPKLIGNVAFGVFSLLKKTLRVKIDNEAEIEPGKPYIVAFWHGKHFLPVLMLKDMHDTKCCTLVSPSRDGTMLAVYLRRLGYEIVHGSSRQESLKGLLQMREKINQGYSIGTGIDGPLGPRHKVKPGFIYLSQQCQVPIIPVGSAYSRFWQFHKAWDKFELPKPFSKVAIALGKPFQVSADSSIEEASRELTKRLHAADQKAAHLLGNSKQVTLQHVEASM